jgi:stearoyl-CoA desaturase (delta-9 desaturase)
MKEFDKRWIMLAFQLIGTVVSVWALLTLATVPLVLASLLMFFLFKCIGITITYHRIHAHRAVELKPWVEFICTALGFYGSMLSPVGWAGIHNDHHKYADTDRDPILPSRLGWKGLFAINWYYSTPQDGDVRTMVRLMRNPITAFFHNNYYKLMLVPFILLIWPKIFLFFFLIPLTLSIWSQQVTIYSHDTVGPYKTMNLAYAIFSMGEHHHKWHHDHPGDTSGEGWLHYIIKSLEYKKST